MTLTINGAQLASRLNNLIDDAAGDGSRGDVIDRMASAAGISASTVGQILRAEINCPPLSRLNGFASALDVSASSLRRLAENDGCNYDVNGNAAECRINTAEASAGRVLLKLRPNLQKIDENMSIHQN